MKIALIPLDERPVNTRYPAMIADIMGVEVMLPPKDILSDLRTPANVDALMAWLHERSQDTDAQIVSVETLAYGGLIPSRTTHEDAATIIKRLSELDNLPAGYIFNVITRIPDANDAVEEPDYWGTYGRRLHRYSALIHRHAEGQPVGNELDTLRAEIPTEIIDDLTRRRLRNHTVNMHLLGMAARLDWTLLVVSSDDTSTYGMGSQEKAWLSQWATRLRLSDDKLLMYPGADEIGCVLVARAGLQGKTVRCYVHYAIDADRERIAPYEDSPIRVTVERQIRAVGGQITDRINDADFIVAVNPPSAIGQEYDAEHRYFQQEHARRAPYIATFAEQIGRWGNDGKRVVVCDVAYPNGSDPDLIEAMLSHVDLRQLAAYGAWNTAGNTVGTALAQGIASRSATTPEQQAAQHRFLLHRFVDDWGYQHLVREATRDRLERETGKRDTSPDNQLTTIAQIERDLNALLPRLGMLAARWRVTNVRLPWNRTFEVDFDMERD